MPRLTLESTSLPFGATFLMRSRLRMILRVSWLYDAPSRTYVWAEEVRGRVFGGESESEG